MGPEKWVQINIVSPAIFFMAFSGMTVFTEKMTDFTENDGFFTENDGFLRK